MRNDEEKLTQQEIAEGWHWCSGIDDLLANYNDPDGDCHCEPRKTFRNIPMIGASEVCLESGHEPVFDTRIDWHTVAAKVIWVLFSMLLIYILSVFL